MDAGQARQRIMMMKAGKRAVKSTLPGGWSAGGKENSGSGDL